MDKKTSIKFHSVRWARAVGLAGIGVGLLLFTGTILDPTVGIGGAVTLGVAGIVAFYIGFGLAFGYVELDDERLTKRFALSSRRIERTSIVGFELCAADTYIRGQRSIGLRTHDGRLLILTLLAVYPTRRGLDRLNHQYATMLHWSQGAVSQ